MLPAQPLKQSFLIEIHQKYSEMMDTSGQDQCRMSLRWEGTIHTQEDFFMIDAEKSENSRQFNLQICITTQMMLYCLYPSAWTA
jgi:hypothetical protein